MLVCVIYWNELGYHRSDIIKHNKFYTILNTSSYDHDSSSRKLTYNLSPVLMMNVIYSLVLLTMAPAVRVVARWILDSRQLQDLVTVSKHFHYNRNAKFLFSYINLSHTSKVSQSAVCTYSP